MVPLAGHYNASGNSSSAVAETESRPMDGMHTDITSGGTKWDRYMTQKHHIVTLNMHLLCSVTQIHPHCHTKYASIVLYDTNTPTLSY